MRKIILLKILGWLVTVAPVLIYAGINLQGLTIEQGTALTFMGVVIVSMIALSIVIKVKIKSGVIIFLIGIVCFVIADRVKVISIGLILVGLGLSIDNYILQPYIKWREKELNKNDGKEDIHTTD